MSGHDFLALVLQSSNSVNLNSFFNFSAVYFFLVTSSVVNWCVWGPCVSWCCLGEARNVFYFFLSENFFPVKTHVFGRSLIFCTFCLYWWGFEFAPARGSLASVSDFIVNSQGYITVEHVRTWLLGSSLTKFLQFWSTCFFFFFLQFISSWIQSPIREILEIWCCLLREIIRKTI